MFSAIKSLFVGDSSNQNQTNQIKENKPLKSDVSNNNTDSIKKKTIIKGEKNEFDFSEEYEDEPKQNTIPSSSNNEKVEEIKKSDLISNPIQNMADIDFWRMAHCVYVKNSLININMFNYVPFIKLKKMSEGLLSYIGFGREGIQQLKYLAGFDEHFLYMINLSKDENKNDNDAMKTIGNHYDINKITNIEVVQDDNFANKILINILFVLDNDVNNYISKIKKLYFEKPNALRFLNLLKAYLNINKIKVTLINNVFKDFSFNENVKNVEKENVKKEEEKKEENINENKEEENKEENKKDDKDKENEEEIFTSENVEEKKDES